MGFLCVSGTWAQKLPKNFGTIKRNESQTDTSNTSQGKFWMFAKWNVIDQGLCTIYYWEMTKICLRNNYQRRQLWGGTQHWPHMICIQEVINIELHLWYSIIIRLRDLLSELLFSIKMKHRMLLLFWRLKVIPKGNDLCHNLPRDAVETPLAWCRQRKEKHSTHNSPALAGRLSRWPGLFHL